MWLMFNQTMKDIFVPHTIKINLPKKDVTINCDIYKLTSLFQPDHKCNASNELYGTINIRIPYLARFIFRSNFEKLVHKSDQKLVQYYN
jgi:hypothetical protein